MQKNLDYTKCEYERTMNGMPIHLGLFSCLEVNLGIKITLDGLACC